MQQQFPASLAAQPSLDAAVDNLPQPEGDPQPTPMPAVNTVPAVPPAPSSEFEKDSFQRKYPYHIYKFGPSVCMTANYFHIHVPFPLEYILY